MACPVSPGRRTHDTFADARDSYPYPIFDGPAATRLILFAAAGGVMVLSTLALQALHVRLNQPREARLSERRA